MEIEIIDRINFLDNERADILAAIPNAKDMTIFRWLKRRQIRNERTCAALGELLAGMKAEVKA